MLTGHQCADFPTVSACRCQNLTPQWQGWILAMNRISNFNVICFPESTHCFFCEGIQQTKLIKYLGVECDYHDYPNRGKIGETVSKRGRLVQLAIYQSICKHLGQWDPTTSFFAQSEVRPGRKNTKTVRGLMCVCVCFWLVTGWWEWWL